MPLDSDVALLGTGVAPLVAAGMLAAEGKSVLVLNPDWDFFGENSELPLDPLWPSNPNVLAARRLRESLSEEALDVLRPGFPGAIEYWPASKGWRDGFAPHVRGRSRLWVQSADHLGRTQRMGEWEAIEDMYVHASDAGLNPQTLQGLPAQSRFPGFSGAAGKQTVALSELRGVMIPGLCDVDVSRYRNGLREFIRERLGSERIRTAVSQLELTSDGVRFRSDGLPRNARLREGLIVFWTPGMSKWVLSQAKKSEATPVLPKGVRVWEEWSLISREPVDPSIVGMFENMAVWAEVEGTPTPETHPIHSLAVLRAGSLLPLDRQGLFSHETMGWASAGSFNSLSRLCHDFLKWEKFSVRSMRPRALMEWEPETADKGSLQSFQLHQGSFEARVVCGGDGPLIRVVKSARLACSLLPGGGGL